MSASSRSRAQDAYIKGMQSVDAAEQRLQAELLAEGKAMTPFGIADIPEDKDE